jgi:membrane fusion protein (multidrug efflux system)
VTANPLGTPAGRWTAGAVVAALLVGGWLAFGRQASPENGRAGPAPVGVIGYVVAKRPFVDALEALGTLAANESIRVTSRVSNVITSTRFTEGAHVPAGTVLVTLEDSEARANLAAAEAALVESRNAHQRGQEVSRERLISESQLDQLEAKLRADEARVRAAQAQVADHTIRAPFAGRVGLRRVSVGSLITPGTEITTLDDTSTMKLDFSVPETFLATVREGLEITARSSAYPDIDFKGRVATVDTRVDPTTRAVAVRALLPNPRGQLKPGMFLTVRLIRERSDALLVPEQALVPEQDKQFVFLIADGKAVKREVAVGRRQPGWVEIVSGLAPGDVVIAEGTQKVRDGAPVETQTAQAVAE